MIITERERKIILLLRKLEQHQRMEIIKLKENEFAIKKQVKVDLEELYKDNNLQN